MRKLALSLLVLAVLPFAGYAAADVWGHCSGFELPARAPDVVATSSSLPSEAFLDVADLDAAVLLVRVRMEDAGAGGVRYFSNTTQRDDANGVTMTTRTEHVRALYPSQDLCSRAEAFASGGWSFRFTAAEVHVLAPAATAVALDLWID